MIKRAVAVAVIIGLGFLLFLFFLGGEGGRSPAPTAPLEPLSTYPERQVIGLSVEGRRIEAYTYSPPESVTPPEARLLFVGGIHGGYEWNSVLLAYNFMDYLAANRAAIPAGLAVTVIPSANPDGVFKIIGKVGRFSLADVPADQPSEPGRFNANQVDLNRNFDCQWQPESTWRGAKVSGGTAVFSEPESRALRDFVLKWQPSAVVFWHSQANAVYASACETEILPETSTLMKTYAAAAGYPAIDTFDAYPVTGAAEDWLASINIPAITVELKTHETIEWEANLKGIKALFEHYKVDIM